MYRNNPMQKALTKTEKTIDEFREIYNKAMKDIPNAAFLTNTDGLHLLEKGGGYFVHTNGMLLGIGIARLNKIEAIVSLVPGCGKTILLTLAHALTESVVELEVAKENIPAMRLYEKLGFVPVEEIARWYKIL